MTGRQSTPRQDPLPPEVGFGELMTRMISANRVEQAQRAKADGLSRIPAREAKDTRGAPESPAA